MRVALVYDRVNKWGGAERVLLTLHEMFPKAPLYTSVYNPKTAPWAKVFPKVIPSFLQNIPYAPSHHEKLAFLMPTAFESFNFDNYDLVISVTSEAAKGIITRGKTKHLCYCLTPTRYLWSGYKEYFKGQTLKVLTRTLVEYLRSWDRIAAKRPNKLIAVSDTVRRRIKKFYKRSSTVIYPTTSLQTTTALHSSVGKGHKQTKRKYFLLVSRLVPYKKIDLAIRVFNKLNKSLIIVGSGSEEKRLKKIAGKNIFFTGQLTEGELRSYYENCEALIMPQEEDFGLVSIEAQSFGRPVIAYGKGGAVETVVDGETGILFKEQTIYALSKSVNQLVNKSINEKDCKKNAMKFSKVRFKKEFLQEVRKLL